MEKEERRQYLLENLIYLIIWVVILSAPIWEYKYNNRINFDWKEAFLALKFIAPLMIVFLINNYILLPVLLIRKKYSLYLIAIFCILSLMLSICFLFNPPNKLVPNRPPWETHIGFKQKLTNPIIPQPPSFGKKPGLMFPLLNSLFVTLLIIGFNVAIKLLFKSIRDDHRMKALEKHNLQTELENLKHQINPHFFMNTLNNIHALIDLDTEKAKETILELSKMMRYVLYDAAQPSLPLAKEIQFLTNYIGLMRLRYTDRLDIQVSIPEQIPETQIPPLLFISFVENAFKHGISYQQSSYIHITFEIVENILEFHVVNSYFAHNSNQQAGVGLENIRKRLQLIYADRYLLNIQNIHNEYRVSLLIPIEL